MKIRKLLAVLLAFVLIVGLFAGCGKAAMDSAGNMMDYPAEAPEAMAPDYGYDANGKLDMESGITDSAAGAPDTTVTPQNQKLIRTIRIDAETEDMDTLLSQVEKRVGELGGYVEAREIYNGSMYNSSRYRNASLTIRIPAAKLDSFVDHVGQVSNITNNVETTDDVTLQYVSIESRIKALQIEEERLLELLAKADNMSDLLIIESRLTDVRYELENITSQLRVLENKVNYGTIHLDVSEVVEYTEPEPENGWQRMGKGFVNSMKGLWTGIKEVAIFLVAAIPYLLLIGGIAVAVIFIIRGSVRRKRRKNAAKKAEE